MRNKALTQQRLLAAVGQVLTESGFSGLGVNAVAKIAGVDKVLIYRYFGDFEGLCRAYAESSDFWPTVAELIDDEVEFLTLPLEQRLILVSQQFSLAMRSRPLTLELLVWELSERNAFIIELERVRELFGIQLTELINRDLPTKSPAGELDWPAIMALIGAATQYLALRARHINTYNGVEIGSDEGWQRLDRTIEMLVNTLVRK